MQTAIIISTVHRTTKTDLAGANIKQRLLDMYDWEEAGSYDNNIFYKRGSITLYSVNNECIHHEDIDKKIEADLFVFATTHSSASGIPSLSVHMVGNFDEAALGGKPKTLGITDANLLTQLYINLKKNNTLDFDTIIEATHHGPFLNKPVVFIEIGSSENEWPNKEAGAIIAKTIMETLSSPIPMKPTVIGFGGPHHCPQMLKALDKYALGHVCPKYNIVNIDEYMIRQMIDKTIPKPKLAILDWKGMGQEKQRVFSLLEKIGIDVKKTSVMSKDTLE